MVRSGTVDAGTETGGMIVDETYQVFDSTGRMVLNSKARCRYPRTVELSLLDAGYIVKLDGKKLTKTDIRKSLDLK